MGARSISAAELRAECELLESAVLATHAASEDALKEARPARGVQKDAREWLRYYRWLHRAHAVANAGGASQKSPGGMSKEEADAIVLDALRAEPVRVELGHTEADGSPTVVHVHPKSAHTLLSLNARDRVMQWLTERVGRLYQSHDPAHLALLARAQDEQLYQLRVFASVVCHEGPGSPYADSEERPTPAEWTRDLSPLDFLRVVNAHLELNSKRLLALSALVTSQADGTGDGAARLSWAVFFASMADSQHTSVESLMRDRSLAALMAAAYTASAHKAEVIEEAKRQADRKGGRGAN